MNKFLVIILCLSWTVQAEVLDVLSVDRSVPNNFQLSFPNNENIYPKISDFKVVNSVLMSSEAGERWSVITLTNLANGTRELNHRYLMALFADGSRSNPQEYLLTFKAKETQSITVSFGHHKFPILTVYSSLEE